MRLFSVILIIFFSSFCQAQVLVKSEHSVKQGLAEMNQFPKTCIDDCSFILYLEVSTLYFDENIESGAFIVIFGDENRKYLSFGVRANSETKTPELVVINNVENDSTKRVLLATSELKKWEGFKVSWVGKNLRIENIRSVKKIGYDDTPYSALEKSGIKYDAELEFEPSGFGYMFMSTDVNLWIDVNSQSYNSNWGQAHGGN